MYISWGKHLLGVTDLSKYGIKNYMGIDKERLWLILDTL